MNGEHLKRLVRQTGIPPKQLRKIAAELEGDDLDYAALKNSSLRDICDVKGIEVPAKATKAELVELLETT